MNYELKMNRFQLILLILTVVTASCGQRQTKGNTSLTFKAIEVEDFVKHPGVTKNETGFNLQKINLNELPEDVLYMGDFSEAYRYVDPTGENIVVLTETGVTTTADEDENILSCKAIYAYRFLKKDNTWKEVWSIHHYEDECINYPVAEFVKESFSITDLDNNGMAEIWLVFISSCHGDISPDKLFIRLDDNQAVYMMSGERRLKLSDEFILGGEYTFDEKFIDRNTPSAFREYAMSMWDKYVEYKKE